MTVLFLVPLIIITSESSVRALILTLQSSALMSSSHLQQSGNFAKARVRFKVSDHCMNDLPRGLLPLTICRHDAPGHSSGIHIDNHCRVGHSKLNLWLGHIELRSPTYLLSFSTSLGCGSPQLHHSTDQVMICWMNLLWSMKDCSTEEILACASAWWQCSQEIVTSWCLAADK